MCLVFSNYGTSETLDFETTGTLELSELLELRNSETQEFRNFGTGGVLEPWNLGNASAGIPTAPQNTGALGDVNRKNATFLGLNCSSFPVRSGKTAASSRLVNLASGKGRV